VHACRVLFNPRAQGGSSCCAAWTRLRIPTCITPTPSCPLLFRRGTGVASGFCNAAMGPLIIHTQQKTELHKSRGAWRLKMGTATPSHTAMGAATPSHTAMGAATPSHTAMGTATPSHSSVPVVFERIKHYFSQTHTNTTHGAGSVHPFQSLPWMSSRKSYADRGPLPSYPLSSTPLPSTLLPPCRMQHVAAVQEIIEGGRNRQN